MNESLTQSINQSNATESVNIYIFTHNLDKTRTEEWNLEMFCLTGILDDLKLIDRRQPGCPRRPIQRP